MAKKRARAKDRLPNRHYEVMTWAAASTTVVVSTFETLMSARDNAGWLISRIDAQPRLVLDGWANTQAGVSFQLSTGAQTAILNTDDDEVVGTWGVATALATNGGYVFTFPVSWIGPILVASRQLTCAMQASDDVAPLQASGMVFTIWYNWVQLGDREYLDVIQGKGIL